MIDTKELTGRPLEARYAEVVRGWYWANDGQVSHLFSPTSGMREAIEKTPDNRVWKMGKGGLKESEFSLAPIAWTLEQIREDEAKWINAQEFGTASVGAAEWLMILANEVSRGQVDPYESIEELREMPLWLITCVATAYREPRMRTLISLYESSDDTSLTDSERKALYRERIHNYEGLGTK